MPNSVWFAIAFAVFVLAVAGYVIYRWGPSSERRTLICPEKKLLADILVERKEGTFGTLLPRDVVSCSLLPGGPINCSKVCVH